LLTGSDRTRPDNTKAGFTAGLLFEQLSRRSRSSRVHKTKLMEPAMVRNLTRLTSLSAQAMQTREEKFND
jgi:hypothetical protein